MSVVRMSDLDLSGKRVLIREDLNVPVREGEVTSDARIRAALPTIRAALDAGAAVMLMSHLGRPTEGSPDDAFSLQPVAQRLAELLGRDVPLQRDWIDGIDVSPGDIVLLENVRFLSGEKACDEQLARKMAALCDVFVMDAFGTAHRAQASTYGVAEHAPVACAGPLLAAELEALGRALDNPPRPLVAIVGGSKVSTKLDVLDALAGIVDYLIVGGGILWYRAFGRSRASRESASLDALRIRDTGRLITMTEEALAQPGAAHILVLTWRGMKRRRLREILQIAADLTRAGGQIDISRLDRGGPGGTREEHAWALEVEAIAKKAGFTLNRIIPCAIREDHQRRIGEDGIDLLLAEMPPENIIAMFDAAYESGFYTS